MGNNIYKIKVITVDFQSTFTFNIIDFPQRASIAALLDKEGAKDLASAIRTSKNFVRISDNYYQCALYSDKKLIGHFISERSN